MTSPSCAPRAGSQQPQPQPQPQPQQQQQQPASAVQPARDHLAGAAPGCDDRVMAQEPERCSVEEQQKEDAHDDSATSRKPRKSVRWSSITVHEFGVGLGGSAVSNKGGPSIGLADTPEFTWTTRVGEMAECVEGVHRFSRNQRIRLLQAAGIPDGIITRHARETNIILGSRRRSTTSWDEDEAEEEEGEGEGDDEEEQGLECKEPLRKRSADQAMLERPCAVYLRRPRMIPVNYV